LGTDSRESEDSKPDILLEHGLEQYYIEYWGYEYQRIWADNQVDLGYNSAI